MQHVLQAQVFLHKRLPLLGVVVRVDLEEVVVVVDLLHVRALDNLLKLLAALLVALVEVVDRLAELLVAALGQFSNEISKILSALDGFDFPLDAVQVVLGGPFEEQVPLSHSLLDHISIPPATAIANSNTISRSPHQRTRSSK